MIRFPRPAGRPGTGALLAALCLFSGCAQLQLGQPKPTLDNQQAARAVPLHAARVGAFVLAPGKPAEMDRLVFMRGANSVGSPVQQSFARYLGATLETELAAAGLLDPASSLQIRGTLTDVQVTTAGQGHGELAARFELTRDGQVRFDKELRATSDWESSFVAALAVPAAAGEYEGLYRKLVGELLRDPDFRKALAK